VSDLIPVTYPNNDSTYKTNLSCPLTLHIGDTKAYFNSFLKKSVLPNPIAPNEMPVVSEKLEPTDGKNI
jgi:hypothetical protein